MKDIGTSSAALMPHLYRQRRPGAALFQVNKTYIYKRLRDIRVLVLSIMHMYLVSRASKKKAISYLESLMAE